MRAKVAASEHAILTVARALVGEATPESAEPVLRASRELPAAMGPTASALLRETLSRGVVLCLARRGGWRRDKHLAQRGDSPGNAAVVEGRLWERHAELPPLVFTGATALLLRWMVHTPLGAPDRPLIVGTLSLADEVVAYLACDLLVRTGFGRAIATSGALGKSPLAWLGFPAELRGEKQAGSIPDAIRFAPLLAPGASAILEALQSDLAVRWTGMERAKRHVKRCDRMEDLGDTQAAVLDAFFTACDSAGRRDLAGFAVEAAARVLPSAVPATQWSSGLDKSSALRERAAARRAAGAFLRSLARLRAWSEEHRTTRFFEDGYDAAQLLLSRWERFGDEGWARAEGVLRELDSLQEREAEAHAQGEGATTG